MPRLGPWLGTIIGCILLAPMPGSAQAPRILGQMASDFDGDGKAELTLYRPSTGQWFLQKSSTNFTTSVSYPWNLSTDIPAPGDFDGDGKADIAVY